MKKLNSILLVFMLFLCSLVTGCGKKDDFRSKPEENYDNNVIQNSETSDELSGDNNSSDNERQIIYDEHDIKIIFDSIDNSGFSSDAGGNCYWMKLDLENNSDYRVDYEFKYLSINGLLLFNGHGEWESIDGANAHETSTSSMAISHLFLGESGIDTIKSIEMVLDIECGPDNTVITTDPIIVNVDVPCDFEVNNYGIGTPLSSTEGFVLNYCSTKINTHEYDEKNWAWSIYTFYFENTISEDIDIEFENLIINGESIDYYGSVHALAGMKGYAVIAIPGHYVDNFGITGVTSLDDINSVSAEYKVYSDDYCTILAKGKVDLY